MSQSVQEVTEADRDGQEAGPERTCAVSRTVLAPDRLIRFVRAPDGQATPDLARRLPGRGVWVECSRSRVETAIRTGVFAKSLKQQVSASPDLAERVDKLLLRRAIDALSLANKAGLVVAGFAKVDAAVASGHCQMLVHAADAAADGAGKLTRKLRAVWQAQGNTDEPVILDTLTSADLSLAMGRANVVHAALTKGGAAANFLRDAERLQRYRASPDALAKGPRPGAKTEQV
jgi:predicted RNA-binding protein YlxR (DUF448 family)